MKTMKKILIYGLCVIAVAVSTVWGTLAYLTDRDAVVNTFTVGQVAIKLDEADVDENGVEIPNADRVQSNEYHLLPGGVYTKDPMVTVQPDSAESYIRMIMTVHNASAVQKIIDNYKLTDFLNLIDGWDETVWLLQGEAITDEEANTISSEFRYKETVSTEENGMELPPLFTHLEIPGAVTGEELAELYEGGFKMEVIAHAIQASGFENEEEAWTAFEEQTKNKDNAETESEEQNKP